MTEDCDVCHKNSAKCIYKNGKKFCCGECVKHFEDENKPDEKSEVCEFC